MASRAIRGRRVRLLDNLGFSEVSRIYCEEAGSIRKLCEMLFTPRYEGEQVGVSCFYDWLKVNNYQEIWKESVRLRERLLKEATVQLPPDFEWPMWRVTAVLEVCARRVTE